ncbi:hypothetical protein HK099_000777 [Clydaea vesicula]|uniref:Uncharacterized protein n=1 Tax=Clydaea vesicula TaxID=447962 RepID=A0AAD5Y1R0_9FUNG|nr:hypothetical protein HK099_000777 [Clydaea vesicula]KAJ3379156.1 hypothetical protein HDU92_006860 [Lobulomyces angularis]
MSDSVITPAPAPHRNSFEKDVTIVPTFTASTVACKNCFTPAASSTQTEAQMIGPLGWNYADPTVLAGVIVVPLILLLSICICIGFCVRRKRTYKFTKAQDDERPDKR